MRREFDAFYFLPVDDERYALEASITREQRKAQDRDITQRLVPLMGQHGWQLLDDGQHWSRRLSSEDAGERKEEGE
jgi:hypothetical protein